MLQSKPTQQKYYIWVYLFENFLLKKVKQLKSIHPMKRNLLLIALLIWACPSVNAQFFKKLKEKALESAERNIEQKTEEKIEETTQATVDSVFKVPSRIFKKKQKSQENDNSSTGIPSVEMMAGMGNASFESNYVFAVTATIEIEDKKANLSKTTMKQGYGKEALMTEMENSSNPILIDMKNQSAILLDINAGTAQVMSLHWMQKLMGNAGTTQEDTNEQHPEVVKTGKTKQMNGYTCHEYNISFTEGKINAWYAPDVPFDYQDYLRGMAKMFSNKKEENPLQLLNTDYGYVMEMTFYNHQNEKQNTMKVTALSEKVRMINMDMFDVQKL